MKALTIVGLYPITASGAALTENGNSIHFILRGLAACQCENWKWTRLHILLAQTTVQDELSTLMKRFEPVLRKVHQRNHTPVSTPKLMESWARQGAKAEFTR